MSEATINLQDIQYKLVCYLNKVSSETFNHSVSFQIDDLESFLTDEYTNTLFIIQAEDTGKFSQFD